MWKLAQTEEQCPRIVPDEVVANEVRSMLRPSAREGGVQIHTARMGGTVVIVRLDAQF